MGVFVGFIAATTLDTACRLQRYVVQELAAILAPRHRVNGKRTGEFVNGQPNLLAYKSPCCHPLRYYYRILHCTTSGEEQAKAPGTGGPSSLAAFRSN